MTGDNNMTALVQCALGAITLGLCALVAHIAVTSYRAAKVRLAQQKKHKLQSAIFSAEQ